MDHKHVGFTIIRGTFPCEWCDKAIDHIDKMGHAYSIRKMSRSDLRNKGEEIGQTSVPMIYHGVRFIGGYTELTKYLTQETR